MPLPFLTVVGERVKWEMQEIKRKRKRENLYLFVRSEIPQILLASFLLPLCSFQITAVETLCCLLDVPRFLFSCFDILILFLFKAGLVTVQEFVAQ